MPNKTPDADTESDAQSDKESDTVQVSLHWLRRQFGRVLEIFVILQFVAGAFIFFSGIFFLLWAVVPATSLKAGSYMLLAFFVIGRASLGLVGYYTDNYCLLFSYGVLLVVTFVVRTILTLVRLKITTSSDNQFSVPPLLQAAPGVLSAPIELVCALVECSQAFCAFYLCWIITKTLTVEKEQANESTISTNAIAAEIAKYLGQKDKKQTSDELIEQIMQIDIEEKTSIEDDDNQELGDNQAGSGTAKSSVDTAGAQSRSSQPILKSILHQPSNYTQSGPLTSTRTTQSHYANHQCPAEYGSYDPQATIYANQRHEGHLSNYPHPAAHHHQEHNFPMAHPNQCYANMYHLKDKNKLKNNSVPIEQAEQLGNEEEMEEDLDEIVQDYTNNNRCMASSPVDYQAYHSDPNEGYIYENVYHSKQTVPFYYSAKATCSVQRGFDSPEPLEDSMICQQNVSSMDIVRALSPTPPSELNSPLLYGHRAQNMYDYGSTDATGRHHHPPAYHY